MRKAFLLPFLGLAISLPAAAPPRGEARLRELVVFPEISLTCNWGLSRHHNEYVISIQNRDGPRDIAAQRKLVKTQPEDARCLLDLAQLLKENNQTNDAQACFQQAEQLCRTKTAAQPHVGFHLTVLGEILDAQSKPEAESAFRKGSLVSSNDWRCWVGLGNFLHNEYFWRMFPSNLVGQIIPGTLQSPEVLAYRPTVESLKQAETACSEASRCYARAAALRPKEPEIFLQRAGFLSFSNWQNCYFRHYRNNEEIAQTEWLTSFFSPASAASLQQAAQLKPKAYELTAMAAYFALFNNVLQNPDQKPALDRMPSPTRALIQDSMQRLEKLAQDADNSTAAGALESLGFLKIICGENAAARADLRRAVALDPSREGAWDLLMGTLVESGSPDDFLAVGEARTKARDCTRNRVILSKIYAGKKGNLVEAARQATLARQLDTNNVVPPLLLAAIALKQSVQTNHLSVADANLQVVHELLKNIAGNQEKLKRWREFALNIAILLSLENDAESARNWAREVLKYFPDDETAKEILKAVN